MAKTALRILGCIFLLLMACAAQAGNHVLTLSQAHSETLLDGVVSKGDVQLPYHWDKLHPGRRGFVSFIVRFDLAEVSAEPYGLYISRIGNAYEVRLNGVLLERNGDMVAFNGADYVKAPRYFAFPAKSVLLHNTIEVRIRADIGRRAVLTPMVFGPAAEVEPMYENDYHWRVTGSLVVAVVSLLVALIAFALWLTQVDASQSGWARRDPLYFYAGIAELFWTVRVSDALVEVPPLPWVAWGTLVVLSAAIWAMGMALFSAQVAGWSRLRSAVWLWRWLVLLLALGIPVGFAALGLGYPVALTAWYAAGSVTFVVFVAVFVWKSLRSGVMAHKVMAIVLMFNALMGMRDMVAFRLMSTYGTNTLQRYSSILFGLTLGYIVLMRFRSVTESAQQLMGSLAARVADKERELKSSFEQLEAMAREQERTLERTRILRDMHDGVGSHISAAIRQLQSGQTSNELVLLTLRDSLDQLKLSIDAMNLIPGDIAALLANVRYRLSPRFTAMQLEFQWAVEELPTLAHLDAAAMRQLQFIVFEVLSNVMQHAQATTLRIAAAVEPSIYVPAQTYLCVRMEDNGIGFDVQGSGKRGLATMAERAKAIGARLALSSQPGATVVELRFPIDLPEGVATKR